MCFGALFLLSVVNMVRCFLIHTVCPVHALGPGESRVLYSRVFGPSEGGGSPEERRLVQREKAALVARQVLSAVSLTREAQGRAPVELGPGDEALALQEADGGVTRLRAGEPFGGEASALWLGVQGLAFTLVCEPHENGLLAEGTLRSLARHCLEQLHMLGPGSEVLLRSDRVDALLGRLLPHGQLLFLNHRFAHSLEKEAAAYASKSEPEVSRSASERTANATGSDDNPKGSPPTERCCGFPS